MTRAETWTPLALAAEVGPAPATRMWDGVPWLLVRLDGAVRVMHDLCPHRRVPLSAGQVVELPGGQAVQCGYHGWAFGADGQCAAIPALGEGRPPRGMGGPVTLPAVESAGVVWAVRAEVPLSPAPVLPEGARTPPQSRTVHRSYDDLRARLAGFACALRPLTAGSTEVFSFAPEERTLPCW